jgi:hypothetical protein
VYRFIVFSPVSTAFPQGAAAQDPPNDTPPARLAASNPVQDTHLLKMTQDILTSTSAVLHTICDAAKCHVVAVVAEDDKGKTAALQLTWTDTGGQVQFAPIVTLALRK